MSLYRSPELNGVIVQIVCVVEIQSESTLVLTNITPGNTCHAKFHASEACSFEEEILIFFCVFLWFKTSAPWEGSILDPGASI